MKITSATTKRVGNCRIKRTFLLRSVRRNYTGSHSRTEEESDEADYRERLSLGAPCIRDFAQSGRRCRRVSCFLREYRRRVICTRVITRIIPRIDFHIGRLRASPPLLSACLSAGRRSHETAILCKSINGASTRSSTPLPLLSLPLS